eukprot:jgi/Mesvir1/8252/Mv12524-RA.2
MLQLPVYTLSRHPIPIPILRCNGPSLLYNYAILIISSYAFQNAFAFSYFNVMQSETFDETFLSDENIVISAPTGSGKTVVFELLILRLASKALSSPIQHGKNKCVYIAPAKALVQQKTREWSESFGNALGLSVKELTGDNDIHASLSDFITADIIFFGDIALILIDEVHILGEDRGAALEALVNRIKILSKAPQLQSLPISRVRMAAISATVPNLVDIGKWLNTSGRCVRAFGEECRPVTLTTRVLGFPNSGKNDFMFDKFLVAKLREVIMQNSSGRPALVFCSTRKGCEDAALTLAQPPSQFVRSQEQYDRLQRAAKLATFPRQQECIRAGVGFHSAGVELCDRELIERLFMSGDIMVLCTTSTLAQGVNLPAHLVVIKSTQFYNYKEAGYSEYDRGSILQMIGRAGRPQFDTTGVAVIMTQKRTEHLYMNLSKGLEPVESTLMLSLAEHLNAEVVLQTIQDVPQALGWLSSTFLYTRISKNPRHYGMDIMPGSSDVVIQKQLKDICLKTLNELAKHGMLSIDEYGYSLAPKDPGKIMAKFYVSFKSMKAFEKAPMNAGVDDIIRVFATVDELSSLQLRRTEKRALNDINTDKSGRIRYPVSDASTGKPKKKVQTAADKIFVLINEGLAGGKSPLLDFGLTQDMNRIFTNVRLARCMAEYYLCLGQASACCSAFVLAQCLETRMWPDSPLLLGQLDKIGPVTTKALVDAGVTTFDKLEKMDPRKIEAVTGRHYPFGNHLLTTLAETLPPTCRIEMLRQNLQQGGRADFTVTVTRVKASRLAHRAILVVVSKTADRILFHERMVLEKFQSPYTTTHWAHLPPKGALEVAAHIILEDFAGFDVSASLVILPSNFQPSKPSASQPPVAGLSTETFPQAHQAPLGQPQACQVQDQPRQAQASLGNSRLRTDDDEVEYQVADYDEEEDSEQGHGHQGATGDDDDCNELLAGYDEMVVRSHASKRGGDSLAASYAKVDMMSSTSSADATKLPGLARPLCGCHCKDKTTCKHLCCKTGITQATQRKKQRREEKDEDEDGDDILPERRGYPNDHSTAARLMHGKGEGSTSKCSRDPQHSLSVTTSAVGASGYSAHVIPQWPKFKATPVCPAPSSATPSVSFFDQFRAKCAMPHGSAPGVNTANSQPGRSWSEPCTMATSQTHGTNIHQVACAAHAQQPKLTSQWGGSPQADRPRLYPEAQGSQSSFPETEFPRAVGKADTAVLGARPETGSVDPGSECGRSDGPFMAEGNGAVPPRTPSMYSSSQPQRGHEWSVTCTVDASSMTCKEESESVPSVFSFW